MGGLAISTAVKYLPVYNAGLIVFSTLYGMLYYQEYKDLTVVSGVLFPVGCIVVLLGVLLLTCQDDGETKGGVQLRVQPEPSDLEDTTEKGGAGGADGECEVACEVAIAIGAEDAAVSSGDSAAADSVVVDGGDAA